MPTMNASLPPDGDLACATHAPQRMTLKMLRQQVAQGRPFAMLTCYDATTARWLDQAGIPLLLVGDSAAQTILGYDQSIFVSLDFMLAITAAVRRGAARAMIMGDMPFMSYQADEAQAIENAGRFLTQGQADLVKLEVDASYAQLVGKLTRAGIPVVAHLGWKPQRVRLAGIRTAMVAGKTQPEIDRMVDEAKQMQDQGAVMLLVEQCTAQASQAIVQAVDIPVIGCGAGPACHGHVVVLQDLLGLSERQPSFVKPTAWLGQAITDAVQSWKTQVESGEYLKTDHPYRMATPQA